MAADPFGGSPPSAFTGALAARAWAGWTVAGGGHRQPANGATGARCQVSRSGFLPQDERFGATLNHNSKQPSPHRVFTTKTLIRMHFVPKDLSDSTALLTGVTQLARRFTQSIHRVIHRVILGRRNGSISWTRSTRGRVAAQRCRPSAVDRVQPKPFDTARQEGRRSVHRASRDRGRRRPGVAA